MEISPIEARVLGALMEKARTTPDTYPLTLNALVNACNQKTSRDPVTDYDEEAVLSAIDGLRGKHLAIRVDMAGSRTAKFRENAGESWALSREEYALLTVLLLRGAQTAGQLRQRSERLFPFAELPQVTNRLRAMQDREEEPHCLVGTLDRLAGSKEIRYRHTLCTEATEPPAPEPEDAPPLPGTEARPPNGEDRISALEETVLDLQQRVARLENDLHEFTS